MGVLEDIAAQFPYLAWLINDPEVGNLLTQAVNPDTTFSPQRFEAELMNTSWWRNRSASNRQWEILANTDPAAAAQQRASYMEQLIYLGNQMGVNVSWDQARWMAEEALIEGLDLSHPHIRQGLARLATTGQAGVQAGAIQTNMQQIKNIARSDWFEKWGEQEAMFWAARVAEGTNTIDDVQAELQKRAISKWGHLADELKTGQSLGQIFAGHIDTISNELEISPTEIDLTDGKWLQVMDMYDPDLKQRRALTLSETRTLARQDDRFWKTSNGHALDAQMTNNLLKTFGARK